MLLSFDTCAVRRYPKESRCIFLLFGSLLLFHRALLTLDTLVRTSGQRRRSKGQARTSESSGTSSHHSTVTSSPKLAPEGFFGQPHPRMLAEFIEGVQGRRNTGCWKSPVAASMLSNIGGSFASPPASPDKGGVRGGGGRSAGSPGGQAQILKSTLTETLTQRMSSGTDFREFMPGGGRAT
jgi:hypothetical protein